MASDLRRAETALFQAYKALHDLQPGAPAGRLPDLVQWVVLEAKRLRLLPQCAPNEDMTRAGKLPGTG